IGDVEQVQIARKAVDMLLSGSEHSVVYRYLERMRKEINLF
ncbi:MAG: RNA-processing protein, partial [Euryarchaeota archaeon CG_4_9_14_3_um_filter_38_12]